MVLVPEDLVQAWFENGISECYTHAVLLMQESATRPILRAHLTFRAFEVFFCSYDHRLACRRTAAKADDVAVGILHIEVLRAPRGRRERFQNRCTVGDALPEEGFDAVHAGCGVEVLIVAPVSTLVLVLRRFLQV